MDSDRLSTYLLSLVCTYIHTYILQLHTFGNIYIFHCYVLTLYESILQCIVQYSSSMIILTFNCMVAENYINISHKESIIKYYKFINYGRA